MLRAHALLLRFKAVAARLVVLDGIGFYFLGRFFTNGQSEHPPASTGRKLPLQPDTRLSRLICVDTAIPELAIDDQTVAQ